MAERWFSDEDLREMSRPTMDRAIEAIEAGELEQAKALCEEMKHEWRFLHDMMVDGIAASMTWVKEHCGEEAVGESQRWAMERYWKRSVRAIDKRDRKEIVHLLAATWRAHSTSGTGPQPGAFTIEEDDEKVTFRMNPCGSGQRLWRMGRYEGLAIAADAAEDLGGRLEVRSEGDGTLAALELPADEPDVDERPPPRRGGRADPSRRGPGPRRR